MYVCLRSCCAGCCERTMVARNNGFEEIVIHVG